MAVNFKQFKEALQEIEETQGISQEETLNAFKESLLRSFKRKLGGDDAHVELNLDLDKEVLELYYIKDVVKDVQDDFLEIDIEEANNDGSGKVYKEGDLYYIPYEVDSLEKGVAISVKSNVHQKLTEVEKAYLLETFKDKIDTLITGEVEKVDEYGGIDVNIGKTTVHLTKKELIGDETFQTKDHIKVYVENVDSASKGGAKIKVSRTHPGFLRCLFFEEIHEIYDGTIKIQNIARRAGERSKVAVYTLDPNVDPAGACIGPNGARIQKIVSQLGNGSMKEKIDIIDYSSNVALYIMDALKPAFVLGLALAEDQKSATAVVRDDSLSLAIGKKGVNVRLASELTGVDIKVITETQAYDEELDFKSFEEISAEDMERRKAAAPVVEETPIQEDVLPTLPEDYVAPQDRVYQEEKTDIDESLYEQAQKEDITNEKPLEESYETVEEETSQEPLEERTIKVKTTTTLEDLEKSLETQEKKETTKKSTRKPKKEEETKEETPVFKKDESNYMPIYSDEELEEIEEEEALEGEEEDIDYDEYAEYYEDQD